MIQVKIEKILLILLVFTIILTQVAIVFLQTPNNKILSHSMVTTSPNQIINNLPSKNDIKSKMSSYNDTQPIVIKSNSDFLIKASSLGFTGNGSQFNPFIIENFRIVNNTANVNGIDIENTNYYFIIKDNYISCNGSNSNGIYFSSVTPNTATIENNTITENGKAGINIFYSFYVNITNNTITKNNNYGLYLNQADNSIVSSNTITGQSNTSGTISNGYGGIYELSNNLIISKNNISDNTYGISILSLYTNNTIEDNYFANNSAFSVYVSTSGSNQKTIIKSNLFTQNNNQAVWISNSENNFIQNNTFDYNSVTPLWISSFGLYNTITNNSFTNNGEYGIWLSSYANGNVVDNNYFYNNTQGGISLSSGADNNSIVWNTIINNSYGIYGYPTHSNITDNYIENSTSAGIYLTNAINVTVKNNFLYKGLSYGLYLSSCTNVTLTNNTVMDFTSYGIYSYNTNPNKIYLNNFLYNRNGLTQANVPYNNDIWDNGTYGNFWLDYTGNDSNSNGIGDSPYTFIGTGQDNYPLMIWYGIKLAPQFLFKPNSTTYEEGSLINISWKALDDNPNQYQILIDNVVNTTGTFISRSNISISITGLSIGVHNITLALTDYDGFISINTIFITVVDTTPPFVIGLLSYAYNETTTGHILNWNVTDLNPGSYEIFIDGQSNKTGTWTSNSPISCSIDGLLKGIYNVTIRVTDMYNNIAVNTTLVSVYDGTHPIISHPTNITFEYGYPSGNLSWIAMDSYAYNYTIYLNGSIYETGNWTSGTAISIALDYLIPGTFNYTIIVMDTSNLTAVNTVFVTVTPDVTAPIVNIPTDITLLFGTTGQSITWNATDLHPGNYSLYKNTVLQKTGDWNNSYGVLVSLDSLQLGTYNFTIVFFDTNNNSVSDSAFVYIVSNTNLAINSPFDISYQEGLSNYSINWTIISNNTWSYKILRNSTAVQTGNGLNNGSIAYDLVALSVGTYNFTIIVNTFTVVVFDTIFVFVIDDISPTITQPNNLSFVEGMGSYELAWNATDLHPGTFKIYRNNTLIDSGTWTNTTSMTYNITNLTHGYYKISIIVFDSSNNSIESIVYVTITSPPITTLPTSATTSVTSVTTSSVSSSSSISNSSSNSSDSLTKSTTTTSNMNDLEVILFIAFSTAYLRRKHHQK